MYLNRVTCMAAKQCMAKIRANVIIKTPIVIYFI